MPGELMLVGRPAVTVQGPATEDHATAALADATASAVGVLDVEVPLLEERSEWFLEIHDVQTRAVVTVIEILSAANKMHSKGREEYTRKRERILDSRTSLVESDLLRAGEPMPLTRVPPRTDYRILISPGATRPRSKLAAFNLHEPIPAFSIPLLPGDRSADLNMGPILHALCERARFDLRIDYQQPPAPPLPESDHAWARSIKTTPACPAAGG